MIVCVGPVRCCIECRYKVHAKVELDETPLSKLKEQESTQRLEDFQMSYDQEAGRPQALTGSMAQFAQRIRTLCAYTVVALSRFYKLWHDARYELVHSSVTAR